MAPSGMNLMSSISGLGVLGSNQGNSSNSLVSEGAFHIEG